MPKIIVTSRYLKSGASKNLSNYVKYIATRQGSVAVGINNGNAPATQKQQELISELLREFPESQKSFEYADYKNNSTQKNASNFISETLETYADRIGNRQNLVGYLANRPKVVKFGSHGLFSQENKPIDLNKVAKEVANHGGVVWTHVVSLRRDDAQKMGYDNLTAWRELVKRQIPNIAANTKINMKNLRWYAAFHDKETNPHVHIIIYSTDEKEGFLTNHGIEKIRSGFANDIYSDELHHLYAQQTDTRNLLKQESAKLMKTLAKNISENNSIDAELLKLVRKLYIQLENSKGKKIYGYLKKDTKKTVDEIFSRLSQNDSIQKMYNLWCETEQSKHDVYSSAKVDFPELVDNPQFKSVKNMIVKTVSDLQLDFSVSELEEYEFESLAERADGGNSFSAYMVGKKYLEKNDYDEAEKYLKISADSGNEYAMFRLTKLYLKDEKYDLEKAIELLKKSCANVDIQPYAVYSLAKVFLENNEYHNPQKAVELLESIADKNNSVSYLLGKIYLFGTDETECNKELAVQWLTKSAEDGNNSAQALLDNFQQCENEMFADTALKLLVNISRIIEDDYNREQKKLQARVDSKIKKLMQKKNQELGIKSGQEQSY